MAAHRNALQIIADLGNGALVNKLTEKMKDLVAKCERSHQSGKLVLEITFKPAKNGNLMSITSKVKVTEPAGEPIESGLFADIDGNLTKHDPSDFFNAGTNKDGNVQRIGMAAGAEPTRVDTDAPVAG